MKAMLVAILLAGPHLARGFTIPRSQHVLSTTARGVFSSVPAEVDEQMPKADTFDPSEAFINGELSQKAREEKLVENHIFQDLEGHPLSKEYLSKVMGISNVESYSCANGENAHLGLMSNGGRIQLHPGGETAFYKHIDLKQLDHAWEKLQHAPHKLIRDTKSYLVEASFRSSAGCKEMVERTGVVISKCYDAQLSPDFDNPMESKFAFLLEDFAPSDGWYQRWLVQDGDECKAVLSSMAKIHAFFWDGSSFWKNEDAAKEFEGGVWKSGSYIQPEAQNVDQWKKVATEWKKKRTKVERQLSSKDYWDNLGERLQSIAEECGRLAHPFADKVLSKSYRKYRTFTHGDPKSANIFFRRSKDGDDEKIQIGLIDFQWAGFGLAATDVAHFITAAVDADLLVDGGEDFLLKYYYDELSRYLVEYGAFGTVEEARKSFGYDIFQEQYEIAVLDICRLVIAYTWSRFTEPIVKDDEAGCVRTMNKTSYNKSIPAAVWLMNRCDEMLKSRGI